MVLALTGCGAGRGAYDRGLEAELSEDYEAALSHYEEALTENPGHIEYRLKVQQSRFAAAFEHFENGRRAINAGENEVARAELIRALQLDPTHNLAQMELERVEALLAAGSEGTSVIAPDFDDRKELARTNPNLDERLDIELDEPFDLNITQEAESIFETIAELAGLNIIFDSDWRSTQLTINLRGVSVYDALDIVALQTRTFWEPINRTTIIVSPDNTQKRQAYENTIVKTIYLTNSVNPTDLTEAITAIRTLLNMRFIAQSSSMNAIIVRDTPDRVAIAEKIIDDIDKSRPEVLVDAMVLEVDRNTLRELGILPPSGTSFVLDNNAGLGDGDGAAAIGNAINVRELANLNSGSFNLTIPGFVARFLASDSRTRLVQNPSIRATDGSLASIRIGSRVPVASGSFQPAFVGATGTPVVQFQYIDVGVNMDITPRVLLNREISMQVVVQVQATAGNTIISGVALPVFTNRSVTHNIRLNEGETNILGGLITDNDSTAVSGIPGLSKIPFLGRLFSTELAQRDQTEIIVLLTPHIMRMPEIRDRNLQGLEIGPENDTRLRSLPDAPLLPIVAPPVTAPAEAPPALEPDAVEPEPAPSDDAVLFDGPSLAIEQGTTTEVVLHINANAVTRADLLIEYDPTSVALNEITDGGFLSQDGTGITLIRNIDTLRGQAMVSIERTGTSAAVSGEGDVVRLQLQGVRAGESVLRVSEFQVRSNPTDPRVGQPTEVRLTVQ
jgi:general secretion pathway protein D